MKTTDEVKDYECFFREGCAQLNNALYGDATASFKQSLELMFAKEHKNKDEICAAAFGVAQSMYKTYASSTKKLLKKYVGLASAHLHAETKLNEILEKRYASKSQWISRDDASEIFEKIRRFHQKSNFHELTLKINLLRKQVNCNYNSAKELLSVSKNYCALATAYKNDNELLGVKIRSLGDKIISAEEKLNSVVNSRY